MKHKLQNPKATTLNKYYFPILLSQLFNKMRTKDKGIIHLKLQDKYQVTKIMSKTNVQELKENKLINETELDFLKVICM